MLDLRNSNVIWLEMLSESMYHNEKEQREQGKKSLYLLC